MRLTMLGTGEAEAIKCYNTCFILEEKGEYLLVDGGGGNQLFNQLIKAGVDWKDIKNIFVTHKHTDHLFGIIWLLRVICESLSRQVYEGDVNVYVHEELSRLLVNLIRETFSEKGYIFVGKRIHIIVLEDGDEYDIIGYKTAFFDIHSTKARQFGFTMYLNETDKLTCCGDEPYNSANRIYAEGSKWLMHEAFCLYSQADIFEPYEKHHSTVKDACECAERLKAENLIIYHTEDSCLEQKKNATQRKANSIFPEIYMFLTIWRVLKYSIEEFWGGKMGLREDAEKIISDSLKAVMPDEAVRQALTDKEFPAEGNIYVVAAGKAAWQMAKTAVEIIGDRINSGVVVTKYDHVKGDIPGMKCYEAGHPVPDTNSFLATQAALKLTENLKPEDTVLFLLSGGGSALFEIPLISERELKSITKQLLSCGANIVEMNIIRKRLSMVKGGKFAKKCEPAKVFSVVLSDILGDPLDMIASGPTYPDSSTTEDALTIAEKYNLVLSNEAETCLKIETPKEICNVETKITGSVRNLCKAAAEICEGLGYKTQILTDQLECEAREAGAFLAAIAKSHIGSKENLAFIAGGETVVHLNGSGRGGRNQELALSAANGIAGLKGVAVFSVGSDGTDGPTDAAGGYCDFDTKRVLEEQGIDIYSVLQQNDAYHALEKSKGLIITGPTGTNVNDVAVLLIKGE